jgi:hypothetical protein
MEILADVVYYLLLHNSNYVLAAVGWWVQPLRIFDSSMQISRLQEASKEDIATVVLQMIINNYSYAAASTIASQFDDGRSAQRSWWRYQIFEPFLPPLDDFAAFPRLDSAMVTAQSSAEGVIVNSSVWGGL